MLLDRRVEALIVVANWLFVDVDVLGDLEKSDVPTAMIGSELRAGSVSSVTVDNELGAYVALEHLCSLGHREIVFIRGPRHITDTAPRWNGVRSCAAANGLKINPDLVVDLPDSIDPLSSFDAGEKLIENLIQTQKHFTAVMAFDDMTAFGTIRALHKAGIRVPEQCSVIGFDDIADSSVLTPALTTVGQPLAEMGQTAVSIIGEHINAVRQQQKITTTHRKLVPRLIVRASTGPRP
jgi:LacI family transcriptional regulator